MDNDIRIRICGDIEGKILSRLQESDMRIFNLETPVCDNTKLFAM